MVSSGERKAGVIFAMCKYSIPDRTMKAKEQNL